MATIRTLAVHAIVQRLYPRPPTTEADERSLVAGRVVDTTLSQLSHEARSGRKVSATAMAAVAAATYDEESHAAGLPMDPSDRATVLDQTAAVVRAFRGSVLFGLPRPRSRLIVINGEVGVYAQPDYWDGRARIFEMKSFTPSLSTPSIALQLRFFQLAFPGFEAVLVGFDRRRRPVEVTEQRVPPVEPAAATEALQAALRIGRELGVPKVLEYLEPPSAAYRVEEGPPTGPAGDPPPPAA